MAPPKDLKEPRRSNRRSAHSSTSASKSSGSPSPEEQPPIKDTDNHSASSTSNTAPARSKRSKDDSDETPAPNPPPHRRTTSVTSMNVSHAAPSSSSNSKRAKRRTKEPAPREGVVDSNADAADAVESAAGDAGEDEEEESGETRCVCEDSDAAGFMIQCEMCKAWQHGLCMGFASESAIPQGDYYCEQCKPEEHVELLNLLRKAQRRQQRQGSEKSHHTNLAPRASRSHSPSHMLKPPKRRNTMNSRDAAYEESLKELLDSTANEAGGPVDDKDIRGSTVAPEEGAEDYVEMAPPGRKKRKRTDDDQVSTKRKRSASSASERVAAPSVVPEARGESVDAAGPSDLASLLPPPAPTGKSRVRRGGGRKSAAATVPADTSVNGDAEEGSNSSKKHPNQYTYRKSTSQPQPRRPPASTSGTVIAPNPTPSQSNTTSAHEHGTRRNANTSTAGSSHHAQGGASTRGTHHYQQHYNNTQMPMFPSWGLPDYLAHLQSILPNDIPPPLTIRGASSFFREDGVAGAQSNTSSSMHIDGSEDMGLDLPDNNTDAAVAKCNQAVMEQLKAGATGTLTERGVKAKWPAKRMSVADMNKRVRALVEWVGREQAIALDRERRRSALESALESNLAHVPSAEGEENGAEPQPGSSSEGRRSGEQGSSGETDASAQVVDNDGADRMAVDGPLTDSPTRDGDEASKESTRATPAKEETSPSMSPVDQKRSSSAFFGLNEINGHASTTAMMEGLMAELISFQERFGPGAKGQNRERTSNRTAAILA
ncbi:hypothetical protein SCHPADRAFT_851298 [Schizopora paradoxa]|uniref:PHD-type domain-containing protein n=1 Tax=Schizopora paradoxa TaxID=27342 RepID=A0A0H2RQM0_9AGAM|nr:hypothetical protein SCHPADRAFT_851298 [Schizopora paradoxa]